MDIQLKNEYLTNFKVKTVPLFKQGFRSLYDTTLKNNKNKKNLLKEFQATLTNIPQWNSVIIDNEYDRFMKGSNCDWLGNLILAVFKATTKELLIFKNCDQDVDVVVPSAKIFIHSCYIEIARVLWRKPQLMYHKYTGTKASMNEDDLDQSIKNSIDITLNKYLPFETIISKFVNTADTSTNASNDSDKASSNNTPTNTPRNSETSNRDDLVASKDDTHDMDASKDDVEASIEETQNDSIEDDDEIETEETDTQHTNDIKIIDTDKNKSYNNTHQACITYQPKEEPHNESETNEDEESENDDVDESENDDVNEDILMKDTQEDFEQEVIQNTIHDSLVNDSQVNDSQVPTLFNTSGYVPTILTTPSLPLEPNIQLEVPYEPTPSHAPLDVPLEVPLEVPSTPSHAPPEVPSHVPPEVPSTPSHAPLDVPLEVPLEVPSTPSHAPLDVPLEVPLEVPSHVPPEVPSTPSHVPLEEPLQEPQQTHSTNMGGNHHLYGIINDEVNRSIKEINLKTKEHKNNQKIKKHLGLDIDSNTLKQNYKQIRTQLLLENSKRWG